VKRLILLVTSVAGPLVACGGLAGGTFTAMHANAIVDSVQTTLDAFRHYSAAGQWDSLANLYANDADFRFLEQGVVQYRSPDEIRQALMRVAPGTRIQTTYRDTKIVPLAPGVAAVATAFHTKMVGSGGADFGGVLDLVLVHREDGWKILIGHSSTRTP
jgi:ketosteroid isomerase-like protein